MRIVVKVGTSTLAYATGRLNIRHTEKLVEVLSDLKNEGHEVILVSSGAIGMGVGKLSLPTRPKDTSTKQACAAVGQCELMYTYDRLFNAYNHTVAQILLTGVDVEHTERRVNFQNTLSRLLELGALPIINENDTVATDEITSIGDNDTLAAIVACCAQADLLAISLKEVRDGKIFGDLYPLNYREHVERMKKLTCPIGSVTVAFEDGSVITIPYQERRQFMNRLMPEHGAPKAMAYLPENEPELMMILKRERLKRSHHATAGNLEEYLDKLEKTTLREKLKKAKTAVSTQEVSSHKRGLER